MKTLEPIPCTWAQCSCKLWLLSVLRKFEWDPVSVHTRIQLKHVSWNLVLCSLLLVMYLDLSGFSWFNLKERLSGEPVCWFPIRDQQSRAQCILAIHRLPWFMYVFKPLSPSPCYTEALPRNSAVCGRGLGGHSVLFCQLCASFHFTVKRIRGSLLGLVVRGSSAFSHRLSPPSQWFSVSHRDPWGSQSSFLGNSQGKKYY